GHLRGAEETREILGLDEIIFIPALVPPHKNNNEVADAFHRLEMLNLATKSNPAFKVSDIELNRNGPSYTIDTLKYLKSNDPHNEYYFILGTELFTRIDTWKDYNELFNYANFIILNRPGYYDVDLDHLFPHAVKDDFEFFNKHNEIHTFVHKSSNKLFFIEIKGIKLSSTKIRELLHNGKSIKYLVPEKIEKYIVDNKLYLEEEQ
ncbi:MAG: nicotinate (nicotinamide) nucleotide adenylyltransferase, partial [Candidatus Dadabacteria bacterium]|nr:nicotinate (nicotinamide) nucleotide adenylyltransferase [Candidatus Dadabacteria bacterium]NIQ13486.1 nicotinate (nicotinamide) nucleotide adenylyltransferase [Candidatus Dadabacteria bacterium]